MQPPARYTLIERVHTEIENSVYRGVREPDGLRVIVKTPNSPYPSRSQLARLSHEYAMLRRAGGRGAVVPLELSQSGELIALVTEDWDGTPLHHLLAPGPLPLPEALAVGVQIADALAALHTSGVLHKDVKPQNILVRADRSAARFIDLGIASPLTRESAAAAPAEALEGTLAYMAPEQTGRINRVVDARADLYALGVTLYQILTGELPFRATDPLELIHAHIARAPQPASEKAPGVPRQVSAIVAKLLAKEPDERYQSARGVRADLAMCAAAAEHGIEMDFALAAQDRAGELRVPQRLYGRQEELRVLRAALARAQRGTTEVFLIGGYAGVGKSALVGELRRELYRGPASSGLLLTGKFEQLGQGTPYLAFARALQDLVPQLLGLDALALAGFQSDLARAVGTSGQLLLDLVPELARVLGPQPAVPQVSAQDAQARFQLLVHRFVAALAQRAQPLVLFIDDLQWADAASLSLLHSLLAEGDCGPLLFIGAYRDGESDGAGVLAPLLHALRTHGASLTERTLQPLSPAHTAELIGDALALPPEQAEPLARHVHDKTQGNPFFVNQLLGYLHREGLLQPDPDSGAWSWDLPRIDALQVTDNVGSFMGALLGTLPAATRRALALSSCLGGQLTLRTLAAVCESRPVEVAADLWPAVRQGMLLPIGGEYRLLHSLDGFTGEPGLGEPGLGEGDGLDAAGLDVSYRFLHDRVQQAAYALVPPEERTATHLRIARLLRAHGSTRFDQSLFEIADHYNLAAALVTDPGEQRVLADLDLRAGRRAKAAAAYAVAADYLAKGRALVPTADPGDALWVDLTAELAECAGLAGQTALAETLLSDLLARVSALPARVHAHRLRVNLYNASGRVLNAIMAVFAGLAELGVPLPALPAEYYPAMLAELARVPALLAGRTVAELYDAPPMTDPVKAAALELLLEAGAPAYTAHPLLFALVVLKQVSLSLEYGRGPSAAYAYCAYGVLLTGALGQYQAGSDFSRLAQALAERDGQPHMRGRVQFGSGLILNFRQPLREVLPYYERTHRLGMEVGDTAYASYALFHSIVARLSQGDELDAVDADIERYTAIAARTKEIITSTYLTLQRQLVRALKGRTAARGSLRGDGFDEAQLVQSLDRVELQHARYYYHLVRAQLAYLFGDAPGAVAETRAAEPLLQTAAGFYHATELPYYAALALLSTGEGGVPGEEALAQAEKLEAQLALWAGECAANYEHRHLLVAAERARVTGRELEALTLYERAIEAARRNGWLADEALANERCALFHLRRGRAKAAHAYLLDAHYGYERWGATAKAQQLAEAHPHLFTRSGPAPLATATALTLTGTGTGTATATTTGPGVGLLDTMTLIKASQALSGEIAIDRLLVRLMDLIAENAGADRAALVLTSPDPEPTLAVAAELTPERGAQVLAPPVPLERYDALPHAVVRYVARAQEPLLEGAAARFAGDPYLARRAPRSFAALPLLQKAQCRGVLYLENSLQTGVFGEERLRVLSVLCAQVAISVDNATLYAGLERLVDSRTRELRSAQARLIKLERETTEAQLAGGFAHEVRNALSGAQMLLAKVYRAGAPGSEPQSACTENSSRLESLFLHARDHLAPDALGPVVDLLRQLNHSEEELHGILGDIREALRRGLSITQAILDYARLGEERRGAEDVALAPLVETLVRESATACATTGITVRTDVDPELKLRAKPGHLYSVLKNLFINALDAVAERPEAGPDAAPGPAEVELRARATPALTIEIRDTGVGIPAAVLPRIYEPFFTTKPSSGTGLGLGIVRKLVELYGGEIACTSEEGRGTTFTLTFPAPPA